MLAWWPGANRARREIVRQEQELYSRRLNVWSGLAALAFNTGLILLWAGLSVALVPRHGSAQPQLRWVASGVAALGAAAEFIWIVTAQTGPYRRWRRASRQ